MSKSIAEKIIQYEKRSWAMKPYAAFRWGKSMPCPIRFVVNPYKGCDFKHKYCYVWYKYKHAGPKQGFRKSLKHDIQRAKRFGLGDFFVMVSSSTDPFQPIERKYKDTLFALKELLDNGFPILIMTRNPGMLLEKEYFKLTENPNLFIDVTIASLHENDPKSVFYGSVPSMSETIKAIKKLTKMGKSVRIKIEPIVPSVNGIQGQTKEELWELIKILKDAGVKMIISKTMRLNEEVPPFMYKKLIDYYKKNGYREGINLVLKKPIRKGLLMPVFEACKHYKIPFCSCVETGIFPEKETVPCLCKGEKVPPIMSVIEKVPKEWRVEEVSKKLVRHVHG